MRKNTVIVFAIISLAIIAVTGLWATANPWPIVIIYPFAIGFMVASVEDGPED